MIAPVDQIDYSDVIGMLGSVLLGSGATCHVDLQLHATLAARGVLGFSVGLVTVVG